MKFYCDAKDRMVIAEVNYWCVLNVVAILWRGLLSATISSEPWIPPLVAKDSGEGLWVKRWQLLPLSGEYSLFTFFHISKIFFYEKLLFRLLCLRTRSQKSQKPRSFPNKQNFTGFGRTFWRPLIRWRPFIARLISLHFITITLSPPFKPHVHWFIPSVILFF